MLRLFRYQGFRKVPQSIVFREKSFCCSYFINVFIMLKNESLVFERPHKLM